MHTITTTTGAPISVSTDPLEMDLLEIVEAVVHAVTAAHGLDRTYEDMMREVQHVVDQMSEQERRTYLIESLFHATVRFEADRYAAYVQKLTQKRKELD
jgi:hypothetical protein